VLATVPSLVIDLFRQRFVVKGALIGASKE